MRKITVFMHVSLDGYTANAKGEMNWVKVDPEMFEIAGEQTRRSDMAIYGRITYGMMDSYWPTAGDNPNASKHDVEHSTWYNSVEKIVVSRSLKAVGSKARLVSENYIDEIRKLKNLPGKDIVLFGSPRLVHLLQQANLVDDYWIFLNPILVGQGIPMFKEQNHTSQLKLVWSKNFASGVIGLNYECQQ